MIQHTKLYALLLFVLLGSVGFAQQESGVVPEVSTAGNEKWYFIESAYTGTLNVPESLVGKHFVLYSQLGSSGKIKYRQSKGTDDELWAIIGTGTAARLVNKATRLCMSISHSENATGDAYSFNLIEGDQYSMYSGGQSKAQVYTNYTLDRSGGTAPAVANSVHAFRFVPANDPVHLADIQYLQSVSLVSVIPTYRMVLGEQSYQYVQIDFKGLATKHVSLVSYNNEIDLVKLDSVVISLNDVSTLRRVGDVYEVPVPSNAEVFRVKGTYVYFNKPITLPYINKKFVRYDYWSELTYTHLVGWGTLGIDKSLDAGKSLNLNETTFGKGFLIHSTGNVSSTISGYSLLRVNVGKQHPYAGVLGMTLRVDNAVKMDNQSLSNSSNEFWEVSLSGATTLRMDVTVGADGNNSSDHGVLGAPRLYYPTPASRLSQTISWQVSQTITGIGAKRIPLTATASSGKTILYRIVSGGEYATIEGDELVVPTVPLSGLVEVCAVQGGDSQYEGASYNCTFVLASNVTVQRDETFTIPANAKINTLTVYGDKLSAGKVRVPNGLATVQQYRMIYSFVPNEWTYIAFPSNVNLTTISNLNSLGYSFAGEATKRWEIREFTGELTDQSLESSFQPMTTPQVVTNKGYLIRLIDSNTHPIEVVFTFNNLILDMSQRSNRFNLQVDLSSLAANGKTLVAVTPKDKSGNTLTIQVSYDPIPEEQPIDYNSALVNARIVSFDSDRQFRVPLPDRHFAQIFILNKKGSKVLRSIQYQSPAAVDVSNLKPGIYPVVMQFGNAFAVKELIIDRR